MNGLFSSAASLHFLRRAASVARGEEESCCRHDVFLLDVLNTSKLSYRFILHYKSVGVEEREDFQVCKCKQSFYTNFWRKNWLWKDTDPLKQHPVYPACSASLLQSWRSLGELIPFNTKELHLLANCTNRLILSCTLNIKNGFFAFCFRYLLITLWSETFKSCSTKKKKYDIGPKRQLIFTWVHCSLRTLTSSYGEWWVASS